MQEDPAKGVMMQALFQFYTLFPIHSSPASTAGLTARIFSPQLCYLYIIDPFFGMIKIHEQGFLKQKGGFVRGQKAAHENVHQKPTVSSLFLPACEELALPSEALNFYPALTFWFFFVKKKEQ